MKNISAILKSFTYAYEGFKIGITERNMRVHLLAAVSVMVAGLLVGLDKLEWMIIIFLIGAVWSAELFNTAIENLSDILRDEEQLSYQATKNARDLSAAAVLVLAVVAAIVGGAIFIPKFF